MLRYAKRKGSSKSKRRARSRSNAPIPQWKRCNIRGLPGEFVTPEAPRKYSNGTEQHRGHVCLPQCPCFSDPIPLTPDEEQARLLAKQHAKRVQLHTRDGARCPVHHTLLPVNGRCDDCAATA